MKILTIILLLVVTNTYGLSQEYNLCQVPLEYRYESALLDTVILDSPVLVNIDGIGYLSSKNNVNYSNPSEIANHLETCILPCRFYFNKTVFHSLFSWIFRYSAPSSPITEDILKKYSIKFPLDKTLQLPFRFIAQKNDIDIYECDLDKLPIIVLLIRIREVNEILNPKIELAADPSELGWDFYQVRKVPAVYPNMEYVRVAIPATIEIKASGE